MKNWYKSYVRIKILSLSLSLSLGSLGACTQKEILAAHLFLILDEFSVFVTP